MIWREQIVATLDAIRGDGRLTILLVCHELEAIPSCVGRLLMLRGGLLAADGPPGRVMTPEMVESLYGARFRLLTEGGRLAAVPFEEAQS